MDQLQPDDCKEERCVYVAVHNEKKHMQETRAIKLTCNGTARPCFQQQHGHAAGAMLCD